MKRRQLTKNEILHKIKQAKLLENNVHKIPFTGIATLCNYVLWKEEKWGQKRLADYNQYVAKYERDFDNGEKTMEQLSDRLMKKAGFSVEYVPWTETDIISHKKSFGYEIEKRIIEANNTINEMSTRHLLIHFNVMSDLGYGKKRLERNKDDINRYLSNIHTDDGTHIMEYHQELIDKVGIFVEMPDIK